uniref:spermine synthase-like n=1 Tax=Styela clava TaxID=7725 RepID=UPI00193A15A1|nr:spermine synthase-like [Styela clava]
MSKLIKTLNMNCIIMFENRKDSITALYMNSNGLKVLLPQTDGGLFTLDIHATTKRNSYFIYRVNLLDENIRKLDFAEIPKTPRYDSLPASKRGREFSCYDFSDGMIGERDFDKVVLDEVTSRQHIRILNSVSFGNVFYCNGDLNLAESDYEGFSHAMSGIGKVDYVDKTVLILGGGDACVLCRIKDLCPSMITAVDYDQRTIDVTKMYLPTICGDVLNSLTGKNYQIIIQDAGEYLEKALKNKLKFDIVINDITCIPVVSKIDGREWDFVRKLLNLSMEVLKDGGVYITHGVSPSHPKAQELFENEIHKLNYSVHFTKEIATIPSYQEYWLVYLIWKQ